MRLKLILESLELMPQLFELSKKLDVGRFSANAKENLSFY
jgi:hypothetical protein